MFITDMICEQTNELWRFKAFKMDWTICRIYKETKEQFEYTVYVRWPYGLDDQGKFVNSYAFRRDFIIDENKFDYPEPWHLNLSDFELEKAFNVVLMDFIEYTQRGMALNNNHEMPNEFDNVPLISKEVVDNYWNEGGKHEWIGF